jgi:GNAT superfamily N-acetyltransferase
VSEFNIAEYNDQDKNSCIDLLKRTFPGTSDEKTFAWRFESESRRPALLVCAKDGERVISFNSWIPWEFIHNNRVYTGYQSGESATDPDYRRKGIFGRVLHFAEELAMRKNIDFFFGFPSAMSYNAFYNAGYYPIGRFKFSFRIINPLKKWLRAASDETISGRNKLPRQTLLEQSKITPLVNPDYVGWRYLNNPQSYELIGYSENNNEAVFVVKKGKYLNARYRVGIPELIVLDCQLSSFNDAFMRRAFQYLDGVFSGRVLYMRTFFNENASRGKAISKNFHFHVKSMFETLIVKPIDTSINYSTLCNYFEWDIMPHVKDAM